MRVQKLIVCLGVYFVALLVSIAANADDDRPDHYQGKKAESLTEAVAHLTEYNAKLKAILEQDKITAVESNQIHQLTYTLENAFERIEEELEQAEETLEALHLASETSDAEKVRSLGQRYLDQAKPFEKR